MTKVNTAPKATTSTTDAPQDDNVTITCPSGRITDQSLILAPHATTFGVERWFKKADVVSFKQLPNKGGIEITISRKVLGKRFDAPEATEATKA